MALRVCESLAPRAHSINPHRNGLLMLYGGSPDAASAAASRIEGVVTFKFVERSRQIPTRSRGRAQFTDREPNVKADFERYCRVLMSDWRTTYGANHHARSTIMVWPIRRQSALSDRALPTGVTDVAAAATSFRFRNGLMREIARDLAGTPHLLAAPGRTVGPSGAL